MSLDMNTHSEYGHEDWGAAGFRRLCIYAEIKFFLFLPATQFPCVISNAMLIKVTSQAMYL